MRSWRQRMRRSRSKKYEKLETEDPEKKKQEATLDELVRINHKIVSSFIIYLIILEWLVVCILYVLSILLYTLYSW